MTSRLHPCLSVLILLAPLALSACGDDDETNKPCTPNTTQGCQDGQVCEEVASGEPTCHAPVVIKGRIFDGTDDSGIQGATVVALDANGGARSNVAVSGEDGTYALQVFAPRDAAGNPQQEAVTLRVSAQDYQPFPRAPRTALPIELSSATEVDKERVVQNAATDVALLPLQAGTGGDGQISGRVDHEDAGGVLIVAAQGNTAVSTAVTASDGAFTLFNVPAGATTVEGYRVGLNVTPTQVSVAADPVEDVVLSASTSGLSRVEGSVNIVNAPGGSVTSVILVVRSTFVPTAARGEAPAGLRAAGVTGAFVIDGVPPGEYAVLAAFENDDLVRDPDESIGGTQIVFITVTGDGSVVALSESFKVTEALDVVSPGADGLEPISQANPTFVWADDSSEDGYEVRVFDAFGNQLHEALDVPRVTGSETVSYTWSGAQLEPGMVYQFRATSWRDDRTNGRVNISATEDLKGVFEYAP